MKLVTNNKPEPPRPRSRIVGVAEAADYAGVSRWTLKAWIDTGKLPYLRYPGGKHDKDLRGMKVDLNDLDQFIERSKDRNA